MGADVTEHEPEAIATNCIARDDLMRPFPEPEEPEAALDATELVIDESTELAAAPIVLATIATAATACVSAENGHVKCVPVWDASAENS